MNQNAKSEYLIKIAKTSGMKAPLRRLTQAVDDFYECWTFLSSASYSPANAAADVADAVVAVVAV